MSVNNWYSTLCSASDQKKIPISRAHRILLGVWWEKYWKARQQGTASAKAGVGWINDNVVVLNGPYYPCDAHLCTMGS